METRVNMAAAETSRGARLLAIVVLFASILPLKADNLLRFVVRDPRTVDIELANSDSVAAIQLVINLAEAGKITGAALIDRTGNSSWTLPFNVLGTSEIRILLISSDLTVLLPGQGSIVRIYLENIPGGAQDSATLCFQTAILASRGGISLAVRTESVTFGKAHPAENHVQLNNYPNPFNPSTSISFQLKQAGDVDLTIYDLRGRNVVKLISGRLAAGWHNVQWNGTSERSVDLPSGLYICRLLVDGRSTARKMILGR